VVSTPLTIIICIIAAFFVGKRLINMVLRRNDNYDEFNWPSAPTTDAALATANTQNNSIIDISGVDVPYLCAASSCCNEGTIWTDASGCVVDTALN